MLVYKSKGKIPWGKAADTTSKRIKNQMQSLIEDVLYLIEI